MSTEKQETPFLQAVIKRRTNYTLKNTSIVPDARIKEILELILEQAPSTFGSYTTRIVLLLKSEHEKFWDFALEAIKPVTPPEQFEAATKPRIGGFRGAYGTALFFEDPENTKKLQQQFPFIDFHLPVWSQHTSAIHQYILWTALADEGLGCNLQHYNPLVDEKTKAEWKVPQDWQLVAHLVFGDKAQEPKPKPIQMKKPLSERLFVYGE